MAALEPRCPAERNNAHVFCLLLLSMLDCMHATVGGVIPTIFGDVYQPDPQASSILSKLVRPAEMR